jgi:hypothetical protein
MQIGYQWKGMIFLNPTKVDPTHLELQTFLNKIPHILYLSEKSANVQYTRYYSA